MRPRFLSGVLSLGVLLLVGPPAAHSICLTCTPNPGTHCTADYGGEGYCCCNSSCEGLNCVCTKKCHTPVCSGCIYYDCNSCYDFAEDLGPKAIRVASLALPDDLLKTPAPADTDGFSYSLEAQGVTSNKSIMIALLLRNLTTGCRSHKALRLPRMTDKPLEGAADLVPAQPSGRADEPKPEGFTYKGTLTIRDHMAIVDFTQQPDLKNSPAIKVHAEVSEDGRITNYSETPAPVPPPAK
jgi:hypothetical protein